MTPIQNLIYIVGREIRIVRFLYWRTHDHVYLWGLHQWFADSHDSRLFKPERTEQWDI